MTSLTSIASINKEIGKHDKVVIKFYAEWCTACQSVAQKFNSLKNEYPNVKFYQVNVDDIKGLDSKLGIEMIPTFKYYKNKKTVGTVVGGHIKKLKELLSK